MPMDEKICSMIRQKNVLVIDDVTTSDYTLHEILRSLRIVNDDNNIAIFSLIGRNDLMAESGLEVCVGVDVQLGVEVGV